MQFSNSDDMKGNIGYWYNKSLLNDYFYFNEKFDNKRKKEQEDWTKTKVSAVSNATFNNYSNVKNCFELPNESFINIDLTTTYPGLVCGIGYEHEMGFTGEFKLGFSFDHTTGLPVIPGSSVKGALRSAFRLGNYVRDLLKNIKIEGINIRKLENHIFEGIDYTTGKALSPYKKDVFFDAYIEKSKHTDNLFIADDFITSHQADDPKMSPFTEPNPVRFIKVRSNVVFRFPFRLFEIVSEETENTIISAENKKTLFEVILKDLGIGAKTNVGYGQFQQ